MIFSAFLSSLCNQSKSSLKCNAQNEIEHSSWSPIVTSRSEKSILHVIALFKSLSIGQHTQIMFLLWHTQHWIFGSFSAEPLLTPLLLIHIYAGNYHHQIITQPHSILICTFQILKFLIYQNILNSNPTFKHNCSSSHHWFITAFNKIAKSSMKSSNRIWLQRKSGESLFGKALHFSHKSLLDLLWYNCPTDSEPTLQ